MHSFQMKKKNNFDEYNNYYLFVFFSSVTAKLRFNSTVKKNIILSFKHLLNTIYIYILF